MPLIEPLKIVCSNCHRPLPDDFIDPECHDGPFCKLCFNAHRCLELLDSEGRIVKLGDQVRHRGDDRIYRIIEIIPSFTVGQQCVGEKLLKTKGDGQRHLMRTRLMEIVSREETN